LALGGRSCTKGYHALVRQHAGRVAASVLTALATAVVVLALAVLPFLNPAWVAFEQDRSQAAAWTGFAPADLRAATNAILFDLVIGPPDFDVAIDGVPVLSETERGHMRDVRGAFAGFAILAGVAALWLAAAYRLRRGPSDFWRPVWAGAIGLLGAIAVMGLVAAVAFDAAFDLFHRLLFAGGTWTFDPATDRLVQLFPMQFWLETSIAVGLVVMALAALAVRVGATRGRGRAADGEAIVTRIPLEHGR
jgi:integral membrane protein (TIGR01906 family)